MISNKEYASYFKPYIENLLASNKTIIQHLKDSQVSFENHLSSIPEEKENFAYAAEKWTIKEVIQHLIDTERVFCYRALCFARNQKTDLPGFDQDEFVKFSNLDNRNFKDLLAEMKKVRQATICLFESFTNNDLKRKGIGSGKEMSVRAAGLIIAGHQNHHLNIMKERYL